MGSIHPISSLIREANQIFLQMGFTFAEGHLVESEYYNFDALNVPKDHPARDMQDTFYIKDTPEYVLRTHTSPVQVRYMEKQIKKGVQPPYRVIVPGKAFRNEATDMTHEVEFTQIEGLVVGEDISLANLKGTLEIFRKGCKCQLSFSRDSVCSCYKVPASRTLWNLGFDSYRFNCRYNNRERN